MNSSQTPQHSSEGRDMDHKTLVAQFLYQVQIAHVRTRDREPTPLHFDPETGAMVQYLWPVDPANGERLAPSEFVSHSRTSSSLLFVRLPRWGSEPVHFEWRDCLPCATDSDAGTFCAWKGFIPCVGIPLAPQDALPPAKVEDSFRVGDGLFQVMTDAVIRGKRNSRALQGVKPQKEVRQAVVGELTKGVSEERFWATFVQCLFCKKITFRETFGVNHICCVEESNRNKPQRYNPYVTPVQKAGPTRSRAMASRLQTTYTLASISSPAPTLTMERAVVLGNNAVTNFDLYFGRV
ncbi:hypothetical protein FA13DRAFT_1787262 [Coprinellus micaceus]|uniref:Uncharacterized protein n=1 Tax=Coprinellus micaceus TaxID=71717 RepID=A0A4Y7TS33_COPMI|nr:hypothetical protein FA13DRAFT_1787262 [Coprinellus micaceus]